MVFQRNWGFLQRNWGFPHFVCGAAAARRRRGGAAGAKKAAGVQTSGQTNRYEEKRLILITQTL